MNSTQQRHWEQLYELFSKAKNKDTELCVDRYEEIYITVKNIEKLQHGCGQCKKEYEGFFVYGQIRSNVFSPPFSYSANISQYPMHSCDNDNDSDSDDSE